MRLEDRMEDRIKAEILKIQNKKVDMLDIYTVQLTALEMKMYDLVVYLNSNVSEYISFINNTKKKEE